MSTRMNARMSLSVPVLLRRRRRSTGCRRCDRCPATRRPLPRHPETAARLASGWLRVFSARASSIRNAALEPPSLAPTKRELLEQLRVVVAADHQARAVEAAPDAGSVARRFTIFTRPIGVVASNGCSSTVMPTACSCLRDVIARRLGAGCPRDARADRDELPDVLERTVAVEFRRHRLRRVQAGDAHQNWNESGQDWTWRPPQLFIASFPG